ncbi:hypothetical protein [Neobacillus mesonae]|uniref:hypothetical protein n=1 Tax=Neobacillus mesonae TaxID=1193713 RepID=UPI0025730EAA|nr:hypothetical protein [Neobacillus mesonae]MED4207585.1 hypothetical protein [Neobacillus mesonae]
MDKAIIIGVYNFVSFQLCQTLLNKGIEVKGIQIDSQTNLFLEEKRLEIGRNANYIEESLPHLNKADGGEKSGKQPLILSVYDLYMQRHEKILEDKTVLNEIVHYLGQNKNSTNLVIIAPIQFLIDNRSFITPFLARTRDLEMNIQMIYLPTIFGPWQPPIFMFQQAIASSYHEANITPSDREWTEDALFAADAAETMYEIIETGNPGSYLLESGKKGYWEQCAAYFDKNIKASEQRISVPMDREITRVKAKFLTPISEAVTLQKEHMKLLNNTNF